VKEARFNVSKNRYKFDNRFLFDGGYQLEGQQS